jgi:hypothetical protein
MWPKANKGGEMTLEELKENWQLYAVELPDGTVRPLKDIFAFCWGNFLDGLLFDFGGQADEKLCEALGEGMILKTDEEGNCYVYTGPWSHAEDSWTLEGRFVRLEEET